MKKSLRLQFRVIFQAFQIFPTPRTSRFFAPARTGFSSAWILGLMLGAVLGTAFRPAGAQEGFGRFGRYNDDGLLTLNIWPDHFNFDGLFCPLSVRFANSDATASVSAINQTRKIVALAGADSSSPDSLHYTLLYPGFSMDYGTKDSAKLFINTDKVAMDQAPDAPPAIFSLDIDSPHAGKFDSFHAGLPPEFQAIERPAD